MKMNLDLPANENEEIANSLTMSIKHERYHGVAMYTIYNSTLWLAFKLHLRIQGAYKSLFLHRK
jgi:hypothetical protein